MANYTLEGYPGGGDAYPGGNPNFDESAVGQIPPVNVIGQRDAPIPGPGMPENVPNAGHEASVWDSLPDWLKIPGVTGPGDNPGMANALSNVLIPTAMKQWYDADQYGKMGKEAANMADPFGKYRGGYGDMLQGLYNDPSKIVNTPGYKFALEQGLGSLDRAGASKGYLGSGKLDMDRMNYASGLAQQTWNTEANRLGNFAGAQFDPANAGKLWMMGQQNKVNSQNMALGSLGAAYMANQQAKYTSGGGSPYGLPKGSSVSNGKISIPGVGSFSPGSLLPDGRVFWGLKADGTPFIGDADQGGYPGDSPDYKYEPSGTQPIDWSAINAGQPPLDIGNNIDIPSVNDVIDSGYYGPW